MTGFVQNMSKAVLSLTLFVLNMSKAVLSMTAFVLNVNGFVHDMTNYIVLKQIMIFINMMGMDSMGWPYDSFDCLLFKLFLLLQRNLTRQCLAPCWPVVILVAKLR